MASKKSHFQASVESGIYEIKRDNNKSKVLGRKTHAKAMKMTSRVDLRALKCPKSLPLLLSILLSTFSYVFSRGLKVMLPNEDFGRIDKRGNADVRSTFQGREYSIWAKNH